MSSTSPAAGPADVVDLEALRAACAPVVALYRRLLDAGGVELDMGELDGALASMRALPPMKGRMGRALALVASGGAEASTEEVIAALDLLSARPGLTARGREARAAPTPPLPGPGPVGGVAQPSLPGID